MVLTCHHAPKQLNREAKIHFGTYRDSHTLATNMLDAHVV